MTDINTSSPSPDHPRVSLIVAVARNGVIGHNNTLPWTLPDDLQHFRRVTMGKPVLMGRKTFLSLSRPLPGRTNIVLTRNPSWKADGTMTAGSLDQGLDLAANDPLGQESGEVMVIGGAEIYARALDLADRVYWTDVHMDPQGDAFFPALDPALWHETGRRDGTPAPDGTITHTFRILEARRPEHTG